MSSKEFQRIVKSCGEPTDLKGTRIILLKLMDQVRRKVHHDVYRREENMMLMDDVEKFINTHVRDFGESCEKSPSEIGKVEDKVEDNNVGDNHVGDNVKEEGPCQKKAKTAD